MTEAFGKYQLSCTYAFRGTLQDDIFEWVGLSILAQTHAIYSSIWILWQFFTKNITKCLVFVSLPELWERELVTLQLVTASDCRSWSLTASLRLLVVSELFPSSSTIKTFTHVQRNKPVPVYCLNPISVSKNGCISSNVMWNNTLNFLAARLSIRLSKIDFIWAHNYIE